jgi:hypothetical protein
MAAVLIAFAVAPGLAIPAVLAYRADRGVAAISRGDRRRAGVARDRPAVGTRRRLASRKRLTVGLLLTGGLADGTRLE